MTPLPVDTEGEKKLNSDSGHSTARADWASTAQPLSDAAVLEAFGDVAADDAAVLRMNAEGAFVDPMAWLGARHAYRAFQRAFRAAERAHGIGLVEAVSEPHGQDEHASAAPAYCENHQHYKWCEHNGGVMGPNGYAAPAAAPLPVPAKTDHIRSVPGGAAFLRLAAAPLPQDERAMPDRTMPGMDGRAEKFCAWLDEFTRTHGGLRPAIGDAFDFAYRTAWKDARVALSAASPAAQQALNQVLRDIGMSAGDREHVLSRVAALSAASSVAFTS